MSHRCGSGCLRKQGRRSECETCNRYKESRRKTIVGGGKRRLISWHRKDNPHPEVGNKDIAYVLDNWTIKGVHTNLDKSESVSYFAFVPTIGKVVCVGVSMDDKLITTSFVTSAATKNLNRGNLAYFANRLKDMEVRDDLAS